MNYDFQLILMICTLLTCLVVSHKWAELNHALLSLRQTSWPTRAMILVIFLLVLGALVPFWLEGVISFKAYQSWYGTLATIVVALLLGWIPLSHRARAIRAINMRLAANWLQRNIDGLSTIYNDAHFYYGHDPIIVQPTNYVNIENIQTIPPPATAYISVEILNGLVRFNSDLWDSLIKGKTSWPANKVAIHHDTKNLMVRDRDILNNRAAILENS